MRVYKNLICLLVALILLVQPFFALPETHAQAQTPPPAASPCTVKLVGHDYVISCATAGVMAPITFKKTFTGFTDYFTGHMEYKIEYWQASDGPTRFGFSVGLMVMKDSNASVNDMSRMTIKAMGSNSSQTECAMHECWPVYLDKSNKSGTTSYYKTYYGRETWEKFYGNATPPAAQAANINNLRALGDSVKQHAITVNYSAANPSAATLAACASSGLTDQLNKLDSDRSTLLNKMLVSYNQNLDAFAQTNPADLPNVVQVKSQIATLINKQLTNKSIIIDGNAASISGSGTDMDIFKDYYRTEGKDGKAYPSVVVNAETLRQFSEKIAAMDGDASSAQYPIKGIFGLRNKFLEMIRNDHVNDAVKKEIEIAYDYFYLDRNLKYRECAKADAAYAQYDPALRTQLDNMFNGTFDELNISDPKDECDDVGTGNMIAVLIKKGFCGMMVMLKEFADWLFDHAKNWLSISLGVAENKDLTLPTDSDGAAGGNTPGASPTVPVPLAGGGNIKITNAAIVTNITTQATSTNGHIPAGIIPYKADNTAGPAIPGDIVVSTSTNNSITINLLSQTDLASADMTTYVKFQVQFVAGGKGYKFWVSKNGTTFTVTGTEGSRIQVMDALPTIPNPTVNTGSGAATTACAITPPADSIRSQAVAFCNSKKPPVTPQTNWNVGPCISQNMNNTGYGVDIAHNPRTLSDDSNACAVPDNKWVELDTSCCVIRTSPQDLN